MTCVSEAPMTSAWSAANQLAEMRYEPGVRVLMVVVAVP